MKEGELGTCLLNAVEITSAGGGRCLPQSGKFNNMLPTSSDSGIRSRNQCPEPRYLEGRFLLPTWLPQAGCSGLPSVWLGLRDEWLRLCTELKPTEMNSGVWSKSSPK